MSFQLRNEATGEIHALEVKRVSIGAADTSTIVIKDPGVPPTQCFLSKTKLGYFLMNFHPATHITINDEDVKEKMLKVGDRVHIGKCTFLYEELGAKAEGDAPAAEETTAEKPPEAEAEAEKPPEEEPPAGEPPAEEKEPEAPPAEEPAGEPAPAAEAEAAEAPAEPAPPPEDAGAVASEDAPARAEVVEEKPELAKGDDRAAGDAEPEAMVEEAPLAPWEVAPEVPASETGKEGGPAEAEVAGKEPEPLSAKEAENLFGPGVAGKKAPETDAAGKAVIFGYSVAVHGGARDGEVHEVRERITIGRAEENDVVLLSKSVSRRHAEFVVKEGELLIRDLGSSSGVQVNGARTREESLGSGDQVEIGDIIFVVKKVEIEPAPPEPAGEPKPEETKRVERGALAGVKPLILIMGGNLDGKVVPIVGKVTVGSAPGCGLVLTDPAVKASHAEMIESDGALSIRPLAGDVRVNGAEISEEEPLFKGDALEFGDVLIVVRETKTKAEPPPAAEPQPVDEEPPELDLSAPEAEPAASPPDKKPGEDTPPLGIAPLALEEGKAAEGAAAPPAEDAKFRLVVKGGKMDGKSFPVTSAMTIGRESGNLIVLLDGAVSRKHARVAPEEGGIRITDLGSTGGLWVNGKKIQEALLSHGDLIRIGHTEIQVRDISYDLLPETEKPPLPSSLNAVKLSREEVPPSDKHLLTFLKGEDAGCHYELRGNASIGRHKSCDIVIHHEEASGKHAEIVMEGKRPLVKDFGSTNGTRVNGTRIKERYLFHGDVIELGNVEFLFREPGRPSPLPGLKAPSLMVREKGVEKPNRFRLGLYTLIGREEACSIPLRDSEASTEQAAVFERNGSYFILDLNSTNGTKVNGTRISSEIRLNHGDTIVIGLTSLIFKEPDKPLPTPTPSTSPITVAVVAIASLILVGGGLVFLFKNRLFPTEPDGNGGNGPIHAVLGKNLLENGSFEQLDEGWNLPGGSAEITGDQPKEGAKCLRIGGPAGKDAGTDVVVKARLRETAGAAFYLVTGAIRTEGSKGYSGIRLRWTDGTKPLEGIPDSYTLLMTGTTDDWVEVEETFKTPARPEGVGVMVLELALVAAGASGETWFDDIKLFRESQPGFKHRDRPKLQTETGLYTLRAGDTGVFSLETYGQAFVRDGHLALERPDSRGASQMICSVTEGPQRKDSVTFRLAGALLDFQTGEETRFEQHMKVAAREEISIEYFILRMASGEGYEPVISMRLPRAPEKFDLFDEDDRLWERSGNVDRMKEVVEVKWPIPNGAVILSIDPASTVEARPRGDGGMDLRVIPMFTSRGGRIRLTFGKTSRAGQVEAERLYDDIRQAVSDGRKGRAIALMREFLDKFKESSTLRARVLPDLEKLEGEAKDRIAIERERWANFKGRMEKMEKDALSEQLYGFVTEYGALAGVYEGSEFAGPFEEMKDEATERLRDLTKETVEVEARKFLDPVKKALDEGNILKARIFLESLKGQVGLLENLPEGLKKIYEDLLSRLVKEAGVDAEKLFEEVEEARRLGDKEKAEALLKRIIGLFPCNSEDEEEYSEEALKAFKELKGK